MSHLLKFNGDSNPVWLIIMVLDPVEIGCRLFWLSTCHRSNSNHSTSTAATHSELESLTDDYSTEFIYPHHSHWILVRANSPSDCFTLCAMGTVVSNITAMHTAKTTEYKCNGTVHIKKWMDSGKESALPALRKGMTWPLSWWSAVTKDHTIPS